MRVCVCVCARVCERETERGIEGKEEWHTCLNISPQPSSALPLLYEAFSEKNNLMCTISMLNIPATVGCDTRWKCNWVKMSAVGDINNVAHTYTLSYTYTHTHTYTRT